MKKIVAIIQPFAPRQHMYLWEDGNKVDVAECHMREVEDALLTFAHKHDVFDISISTPETFGEGIVDRIKIKEMEKYSIDKLNITIV